MCVCGHSNVRLTTPPVLKLWGTQGYLWLPYDLTEVIKLIGERFEPKKYIFFSKKKYFMCLLKLLARIAIISIRIMEFTLAYLQYQVGGGSTAACVVHCVSSAES